ncbi:MAG: hypothetical protein KAU60_14285, partial [Desulfobacterales bacterium]|nr:hypothetical protein [Desulfobacterales bacterium]
APHTAIEVEEIKTGQFGYQYKRKYLLESLQVLAINDKIKSHKVGSIQRAGQEKNIYRQNNKEVFIKWFDFHSFYLPQSSRKRKEIYFFKQKHLPHAKAQRRQVNLYRKEDRG